MAKATQLVYDFSSVPTIKAFIKDDSFIKGILGPIGSGKSSGCVQDLIRRTFEQAPDTRGVRRTRFAIIRNTYQQLKDTTKKTVMEWVTFGRWRETDHTLFIDVKREDGTVVQSEWLFRALDRPDQVANLLSLELTGAWINEAKELPKEVFENLQTRVDRYPRRHEGYGPTWAGVIMDTNPPDYDHWWYHFFEESKPKNAKLFKQPSGLSPDAENRPNLSPNYYETCAQGKDDDWIRVYVHGEYGFLKDGKPVFSNYRDFFHVWREDLKPIKDIPIVIGVDFGLTPAAVFTQMDMKGRLMVLDEVVSEHTSIREFISNYLKPLLRSKYKDCELLIIGDPAGSTRSQVDSRTVFQEFKEQGLKAKPAKTNALQARLGAVNSFLTRMVEGKPSFLMSPSCNQLRKALTGGYCFRRIRVSGNKYSDLPDKNEYSHIADALQYACVEHEGGFTTLTGINAANKYKGKPAKTIKTGAFF